MPEDILEQKKSEDMFEVAKHLFQAAELAIKYDYLYGQSLLQQAHMIISLLQGTDNQEVTTSEVQQIRNDVNSFLRSLANRK